MFRLSIRSYLLYVLPVVLLFLLLPGTAFSFPLPQEISEYRQGMNDRIASTKEQYQTLLDEKNFTMQEGKGYYVNRTDTGPMGDIHPYHPNAEMYGLTNPDLHIEYPFLENQLYLIQNYSQAPMLTSAQGLAGYKPVPAEPKYLPESRTESYRNTSFDPSDGLYTGLLGALAGIGGGALVSLLIEEEDGTSGTSTSSTSSSSSSSSTDSSLFGDLEGVLEEPMVQASLIGGAIGFVIAFIAGSIDLGSPKTRTVPIEANKNLNSASRKRWLEETEKLRAHNMALVEEENARRREMNSTINKIEVYNLTKGTVDIIWQPVN